VWIYIWEYVCVEERVSEAPPAVVRSICGYVGLYVWWRERESEKEGEGRGGGERERNNPSSKPLDSDKQNHSTSTAHQSIDTRSKTYDSSIHPNRSRLDSSDVVSVKY
jgi:hypothetical protein